MKKRRHKVLIVDDEKKISNSLGRILKKNGIEFICCESGKAGLEELEKADSLFSLIISDQRMPGMSGSEFLEKAKEISPATVRILISAHSDDDVLIDAINRGIIQNFIPKPWKIDDLVSTVKKGFMRFKNAFENERLVRLARKQNKKLYKLDSNLNASVMSHKKKIEALDQVIARMKTEIVKRKKTDNEKEPVSDSYVEELFKEYGVLENDKLDLLFQDTLCELFGQFQGIAQKNSFEISGID
ncbi:MAG: response regulator [Desulfobacteraceae bacterium]|nr:response regulator [Desulfobacteraceae bacterium]